MCVCVYVWNLVQLTITIYAQSLLGNKFPESMQDFPSIAVAAICFTLYSLLSPVSQYLAPVSRSWTVEAELPQNVPVTSATVEHKVQCSCDCRQEITLRVVASLVFGGVVLSVIINLAIHCCFRPRGPSYKGGKGKILSITQ